MLSGRSTDTTRDPGDPTLSNRRGLAFKPIIGPALLRFARATLDRGHSMEEVDIWRTAAFLLREDGNGARVMTGGATDVGLLPKFSSASKFEWKAS